MSHSDIQYIAMAFFTLIRLLKIISSQIQIPSMNTKIYFLLKINFLLPFFLIAQNKIIYVSSSATGSNDGSSWQNAYTDLQNALQMAQKSDEIWIAKGVYLPTASNDRTISFDLKNGVNVFGGFNGNETSKNKRDFEKNKTILSGNIGNKSDSLDNSYRIMSAMDINDETYLDGLEITDAVSDMTTFTLPQKKGVHGAGLYVATSNSAKFNRLLIQNCKFYKNTVRYNGAAIFYNCEYTSNLSINLKKNEFYNNVSGYGGCIRISENSPFHISIDSCNFTNNLSLANSGAVSLEVYLGKNFDIQISNCNFNKNRLLVGGEGISILSIITVNSPVKFDLIKCSFSNEFEGSTLSFFGGFTMPCIKYCYFSNLEYGLNADIFTNTKISNSFFINTNRAIRAPLILLSNTVIKNSKFNALDITRPTIDSAIFRNNLFINNKYLCRDYSAKNIKKKFINSIFINNGLENSITSSSFSFTNSILDKTFSPEGITYSNCFYKDPLFIDTTNLNFRLQPCSPAINAGNNALSSDLLTDIDGKPRFRHGKIDIGPYEYDEYNVKSYTVKPTICESKQGIFTPTLTGNCSNTPMITWKNDKNLSGAGANNLGAGVYTFFVKDSNDCVDTVKNIKIDNKSFIGLSNATLKGVSKAGEKDGSVGIVAMTNATPPFKYLWSTGDTTAQITKLGVGIYAVSVTDANGCFFTTSFQVSISTNVFDNVDNLNFQVFPSPVDDNLTIVFEGEEIDFYLLNQQGKLLLQQQNAKDKTQIDVSNLAAGLYILQAKNKNGKMVNKKVIIQH